MVLVLGLCESAPTSNSPPVPYMGVPTLNFDVDLVYTWVNGSDPAWRKLRKSIEKPKSATWDADSEFRFRSHDELKFSLRAMREYAPWIRKVFIVTCCGQTPSWLAESSGNKIQVIDHSQIIPDELFKPPTFNSFAIETWVNRIPGLAERFLLMNDDFFFGAQVEKSDFFDVKGRPLIAFQEEWGFNSVPPPNKDDAYLWASHNVDVLLDDTFKREKRYKVLHQAYPNTKSLFSKAHESFHHELVSTTQHTFRQRSDIIPHFLASWIGIYTGQAVRLSRNQYPSNKYIKLTDNASQNKKDLLALLAQSGEFKLFCIGDHIRNHDAEQTTSSHITDFLLAYFPNKAPWEK